MSKNQKKPTVLSMGGIVPRKPSYNAIESVLKPALINPAPKQTDSNTKKDTKKDKKNKKNFRPANLLRYFSSKILYIFIPAFIAGLYLFDINKFPPLLPSSAAIDYDSSSDIYSLAYLPVKAALVALHKLGIGGTMNIRYLSVLAMFFALFCFYKFISAWVSKRMSLLALLLFSCSSWALFQARHDNISTIMIALIPAVLYFGSLVLYSTSKTIRIISALILAQFLFVPGAIWFFIAAAIPSLFYSGGSIKIKPLFLPAITFMLAVGGYAALAVHWSLTGYQQIIRLVGSEIGSLPTFNSIKANITELPSQLLYSGLNDSSVWLKSTPIIDWISAALFLTGLICLYRTRLRPVRKRIISLFLVIGLILVILNGIAYISLLLPLIYITIALGITYLADQWMIIFPNNPLARSFGFVLVLLIVFITCAFHVERYFIGWPKTEEYHQIYKD